MANETESHSFTEEERSIINAVLTVATRLFSTLGVDFWSLLTQVRVGPAQTNVCYDEERQVTKRLFFDTLLAAVKAGREKEI